MLELVDLTKYERLVGLSCDDMKAEASNRSLSDNIKTRSDIRFDLTLTSRWINLIACMVGYFGIAAVYVLIFGMTHRVMVFINISLVVFPLYFWQIFDRSYRDHRNIDTRAAVIKYKRILRTVINEQRLTQLLLEHHNSGEEK
jgi:hypothetical protein